MTADQKMPDPEGVCRGCEKTLFKDEHNVWRTWDGKAYAACRKGGPHNPGPFPSPVLRDEPVEVDWSSWEETLDSWQEQG